MLRLNLQTKSNDQQSDHVYDFEGIFTDHPCKIYALNGTTKTLIATFYGYQYKQWVDFNLPSAVTADAIVVNKWGNCLPMKIQVFGTATSTRYGSCSNHRSLDGMCGCHYSTGQYYVQVVFGVALQQRRATVSAYGVVTGVSAGTATISYTKSGASAAKVVTVNGQPNCGC
jgi:hypothetical protein